LEGNTQTKKKREKEKAEEKGVQAFGEFDWKLLTLVNCWSSSGAPVKLLRTPQQKWETIGQNKSSK
jgi:hypothetical protein